jgi:hypothetical protein
MGVVLYPAWLACWQFLGVERRGGNPSAAGAASAIFRVIGAASALSAWHRRYGKQTLRIDSVPRGACFPLPDSDGEQGGEVSAAGYVQ